MPRPHLAVLLIGVLLFAVGAGFEARGLIQPQTVVTGDDFFIVTRDVRWVQFNANSLEISFFLDNTRLDGRQLHIWVSMVNQPSGSKCDPRFFPVSVPKLQVLPIAEIGSIAAFFSMTNFNSVGDPIPWIPGRYMGCIDVFELVSPTDPRFDPLFGTQEQYIRVSPASAIPIIIDPPATTMLTVHACDTSNSCESLGSTVPPYGAHSFTGTDTIQVTAFPANVAEFEFWECEVNGEQAVVSSESSITLVMDQDYTCFVHFKDLNQQTNTLAILVNEPSWGIISPVTKLTPHIPGSTVSIIATPRDPIIETGTRRVFTVISITEEHKGTGLVTKHDAPSDSGTLPSGSENAFSVSVTMDSDVIVTVEFAAIDLTDGDGDGEEVPTPGPEDPDDNGGFNLGRPYTLAFMGSGLALIGAAFVIPRKGGK